MIIYILFSYTKFGEKIKNTIIVHGGRCYYAYIILMSTFLIMTCQKNMELKIV